MNEKDYLKELDSIMKITCKKLGDLQGRLTFDELKKFNPYLNLFWISLIENAVGEDAVIPYLIEVLNSASKIQAEKTGLKDY